MQEIDPSNEISEDAERMENLPVTRYARSNSTPSSNSDESDLRSRNGNHQSSDVLYEIGIRNVTETLPPVGRSFTVTPYGTILLNLPHEYKVHMTVDEGIMLENNKLKLVICLSGCGTKSALVHRSGRVYHHRDNIDIVNNRSIYRNNLVKINFDGVVVEAVGCNFLVRSRDTVSTHVKCTDLSDDTFTLQVFHNGSTTGPEYISEAEYRLSQLRYSILPDETENYRIGNLSIFQGKDGMIRIKRCGFNYNIRSSPNTSKILILANNFKCTASPRHLNVSHAGRSVHKDRHSLKIRNGYNSFVRLDN